LSKIHQADAWYWFLLNYFLLGVGILVTLVLVFFTFTVVGSLIASPFNDILSERTEEILAGAKDYGTFSWALFINDSRRIFVCEAKKISFFVAGMFVLMLLHLLPGIGSLLSSFLSVLWTVFFLVVEYTGYVFARKRITFRMQRNIIMSRIPLMFGFGTAVFCVLVIPFFQFLCIPLGVVGATRLLYDCGVMDEMEMEGKGSA
jgi:CysZ protein